MPVQVAVTSFRCKKQVCTSDYWTQDHRGLGGRLGRKQNKTQQRRDAPSGERNGVDLELWVEFI